MLTRVVSALIVSNASYVALATGMKDFISLWLKLAIYKMKMQEKIYSYEILGRIQTQSRCLHQVEKLKNLEEGTIVARLEEMISDLASLIHTLSNKNQNNSHFHLYK